MRRGLLLLSIAVLVLLLAALVASRTFGMPGFRDQKQRLKVAAETGRLDA